MVGGQATHIPALVPDPLLIIIINNIWQRRDHMSKYA